MSADLGQSEATGQMYSRWFTEWPSTHENAGQAVEVVPVEHVLALIRSLPKREGSGERLTASDFAGILEASLRGNRK